MHTSVTLLFYFFLDLAFVCHCQDSANLFLWSPYDIAASYDASLVSSDASTTLYALQCQDDDSTSTCSQTEPFTVTAGPSTMAFTYLAYLYTSGDTSTQPAVTHNCVITTSLSAADCTYQASESGGQAVSQKLPVSGADYASAFVLVTITATATAISTPSSTQRAVSSSTTGLPPKTSSVVTSSASAASTTGSAATSSTSSAAAAFTAGPMWGLGGAAIALAVGI